MTLNGEEKYRQALYEEKRKEDQLTITDLTNRLKRAEVTIFGLERDLEHSYNTNTHLSNTIDRLIQQRDEINEAIRLYNTGERLVGVTLDAIRAVLR